MLEEVKRKRGGYLHSSHLKPRQRIITEPHGDRVIGRMGSAIIALFWLFWFVAIYWNRMLGLLSRKPSRALTYRVCQTVQGQSGTSIGFH